MSGPGIGATNGFPRCFRYNDCTMSHIWARDCHGGSSIVCHDSQMGEGGDVD